MTTDPAREAAEKWLRDKFNGEYRKASPFKLDPAVIAARIAADFAARMVMAERTKLLDTIAKYTMNEGWAYGDEAGGPLPWSEATKEGGER